jgi:hypothetical protein
MRTTYVDNWFQNQLYVNLPIGRYDLGRELTFIDWSDAEGMLELFQEFVRDELNDCLADTERQKFLNDLLEDVASIREANVGGAVRRLRAVQESIQDEFSGDPASAHLADLIEELEGLA